MSCTVLARQTDNLLHGILPPVLPLVTFHLQQFQSDWVSETEMKVLTFGCSGTNEIENDERYTKRAQRHREHEKAYYECRRSTPGDNDPFPQPWRARVVAIMSAIREMLDMKVWCIQDLVHADCTQLPPSSWKAVAFNTLP